ncbi:serine/threonine-protein phosphatase [Frankia sp. CNm7]|uniref:Serine/threonine-protein phosphatase n=1 Tax=Frankia nepalensis TaxID=1836974 RepID=A0A937UNI5_9ACTN|nr:PP2C family protein-serine/threonine phosphatase [Frankia nepalensis]MBL7502839.1 serine/threonine-protein phosphatase [Frankia nepalensis]MBL7509982.1 serine/threonine-protein phosphatase [Frankia nepalensis]MBL7522201.1 serine/threonine-protein phosphatase [Frankia nepalensis]MBL7628007.1 serine/threonine-protein phosphatase [Frankia nepalensis]
MARRPFQPSVGPALASNITEPLIAGHYGKPRSTLSDDFLRAGEVVQVGTAHRWPPVIPEWWFAPSRPSVVGVGRRRTFDALALLTAVERAAPADAVDVLASQLVNDLGALGSSFLIADHSGGYLAKFGGRDGGDRPTERVQIVGTPQGDVLRTQRPARYELEDRTVVYAPVTARGEAIGVIEVHFPRRIDRTGAKRVEKADDDFDWLLYEVGAAAHIFAYIVVLNRRYTDQFEWGRRSVPFRLAAEVQRRLLPDSFTCEAAQATIAGWMEPAATVAGDTFDYTFGRTTLDLSLTDAMGHGLAAALLATLVVSSLRNVRREQAGTDLASVAARANAVMNKYADPEQFVTGLLLRVDLPSGEVRAVNAGHIPCYWVRGGEVRCVHWPADPPFGMFPESSYTARVLQLRPGDRLLLVTDGMVDRNAIRVDLSAELTATTRLHPRELVQFLTRLVRDACDDQLRDDATALCLDWHGGSGPERSVASGADPTRASASLLG